MNSPSAATRTICPYCGVGCGVLATRLGGRSASVAGDPEHPSNYGRLCSKGGALAETLSLEGRLLYPRIAGRRAAWDEALDLIATRFSEAVRGFGPDSVALYVSGQILTEDYYVANKLMKGFIGSANIDTNSRLCMASAVAGHRRAFGADVVPAAYADLEEADVVVLVGSNFAWCHPVLFQRLAAAREKKVSRLVVVDPRRTVTAEAADLHLAIAPDGDVPLFLGLLAHLERSGCADAAFLSRSVGDPEPALAAARDWSIARVAKRAGLSAGAILEFYEAFANTPKVVTVFSQGVNQSTSGTDKVNAIVNCHLYAGRIGKPGAAPFSITGQPNAMGGREVGGLANLLAAHMEIEDADARDRLRRFWASPGVASKPGLKAVELFDMVAESRIKALWIIGTNPVDSLPDADRARAALAACPFVVVSDVVAETDTTACAHVLLPAAAWGEKDGTVTNSERRISRQRAFLRPPGEARPDWWALAQTASRMGFSGFDYESPAAIFREHAALSAFENDGARAFDIGGKADLDEAAYDAMAPFQWPLAAGAHAGGVRMFGDGRFFTGDRRARLVPTPAAPSPPDSQSLTLNTGRIRDQWHTMTRTGAIARLMSHCPEPFCEIHPADAKRAGVTPGSLVEVETASGAAVLRAAITASQRPGSVFAPMHWTDRFASRARANALTARARDPVSGQPGFKRTPCAIRPFRACWHGFAVSAGAIDARLADYWALAPVDGGLFAELAGAHAPEDWRAFAAALLDLRGHTDWVEYADAKTQSTRFAAFADDRLLGALFVSRTPVVASRKIVARALVEQSAAQDRLGLLAGRAAAGARDSGPIVCSCFAVGANDIVGALRDGCAPNLDAVGALLKAGTNCGSCRGEIKRFFATAGAVAP